MLRFNLQNESLANLRFAYSPLLELTISYRVLRGDWLRATYWRWIEEARNAIHDSPLPYMDALISTGHIVEGFKKGVPKGYIPDFLTPTPTQPMTNIEDEFERLLNLPDDLVCQCIQVMIEMTQPTEILCEFLAYPSEAMQALVLELREYWQRTLAHHWNRMIAVLENDILYHSRVLTLNGLETLFPTIDAKISYDAGSILLGMCPGSCDLAIEKGKHFPNFKVRDKVEVDITSDTFHLVPVIFAANGIYFQVADPWEPMILYTPRGAGLWNYDIPEPSEALELTLGAGKSRILLALTTPYNTGELAQRLSLTAGAVSQQLGKLNQAGLVEAHRSGKHVFYRLSKRGAQLVDLFC